MNFEPLESRDCPVPLTFVASSLFPGYHGKIDVAASGQTVAAVARVNNHLVVRHGEAIVLSTFAYAPEFQGGVNVATDGRHVATGTNAGAPHVREWATDGTPTASYYAGLPTDTHGVYVAYDRSDDRTRIRTQAPRQLYLDGASAAVTVRVSEIFAAYNIGITNTYPGETSPKNIATVIVVESRRDGFRGEAVVGSFLQQSEFASFPGRVYVEGLPDALIARAIAHEAGHLFGLPHSTDSRSYMRESLSVEAREWDALSDRILASRLGRAPV